MLIKKYLVISLVLFSVIFAADVMVLGGKFTSSEKEIYSDEGVKLILKREIPKPVIVEKEVIKTVVNLDRENDLINQVNTVVSERDALKSDLSTLKIHTDEAKRIVDSKTKGRQWWDNAFFAFIAGLVVGNLR